MLSTVTNGRGLSANGISESLCKQFNLYRSYEYFKVNQLSIQISGCFKVKMVILVDDE
jgi:hypothetical protein